MDDGLDRPASREITNLAPALAISETLPRQVVAASIALVLTAGVTLSIGQGMRLVIDQGLSGRFPGSCWSAASVFLPALVLLTVGTFARFYFVSWVGERVSADLRKAVFSHLLQLHPGFFETNQPTELQSRITTDTTLLQTVIGSSVSIALRNALMFAGGLVLLFITNAKLSLIVVASVPFVVAPVILFGRRKVRSCPGAVRTPWPTWAAMPGNRSATSRWCRRSIIRHRRGQSVRRRVEVAFAVAAQRIRQRAPGWWRW